MIRRLSYLAMLAILSGLASWLRPPGVQAADPDYTIMVLPDTQYLVFTCSPQVLNVMMNWIVANKNASQGGVFTTNLKAVIGLGDATQQASGGEFNIAKGSGTSGYGLLDANNIPFVQPPGNHDYIDPTTDHTVLSSGYASGGYFSADYRQTHGYFDGTTSIYGDKYDQANYYIRLQVGTRKVLIFSIEYQPRTAVLAWAKAVHDANPGWECILSTHSFLSQNGTLSRYSGESGNTGFNNDNGGAGLKTSQATSDANFNSGYAAWNNYLAAWERLTMVLNGHWIAIENQYAASPPNYHYQTLELTSTSSRAQTVQSIFTNWQDIDGAFNDPAGSNEYPSWSDAPASVAAYCSTLGINYRMGHVMILQFRPSLGTVEGYIIATTNGKWEPTYANRFVATTTTPQLLFTLPYTGVPAVVGAATGRGAAVSAGTVVK
jgi:hypothetical protein